MHLREEGENLPPELSDEWAFYFWWKLDSKDMQASVNT
jgi:hypothetical protein